MNYELVKKREKIIKLLEKHQELTAVQIANCLCIARPTANRILLSMCEDYILKREYKENSGYGVGSRQEYHYSINKLTSHPKSYAVPISQYLKKDNEYLTKESALLLFKQLIEVIEDQAKEIDIFKNEVTDLFKSFESVMNTHKDALDVHDQYLAMIIHTTDILGSAVALIAYQHGKPQPSLIERVMTFKEHIQTLNDDYPINCDKH